MTDQQQPLQPSVTTAEHSNPSASHWTAEIPNTRVCPTCATPRSGEFCNNCGQRQLSERVKFWGMIYDLIERLTDVEQGLFFTIRSLFRNPGQVAKDYVSGKQKCYVNPLTVFLLGTAMQLLALWLTEDVLRDQIQQSLASSITAAQQETFKEAEEKLGGSMVNLLTDSYFLGIQQGYTYAALFFFCVPFAILLRWFHGLMGEPFRLGETTIFALYVMAMMLIVTAILTPITARFGSVPQIIMAMTAYSVIPQFAHSSFFKRSWPSRLLTLLATAITTAIFISSIMVIFIVTLLITAKLRVG
ncbi:MAG: hypothetical protein Aurels2KO_00650 [Aureliella sp.]